MNKTFDKETERKLRKLGNKKCLKVLLLTFLWFAVVIGAWVAYSTALERPFTEPYAIGFVALLILPFFPFKVQKILFSKTFYGAVIYSDNDYKYKGTVGLGLGNEAKETEMLLAKVTFAGGPNYRDEIYSEKKKHEKNVIGEDGNYYQKGDRVFVIRGLKFPVKVPIPADEQYLCPVCGRYIEIGEKRCNACKADFG